MQVKEVMEPPHALGAAQDRQSITKDWDCLQEPLEGVKIREVRNVMKDGGYLTELYRDEWEEMGEVRHIFQEIIAPGHVTAWHLHLYTTDRLFVSIGIIKIALYDAREQSKTYGKVNVFRFGAARPALVLVPPGVWHGVKNIGHEAALLLNLTDQVYEYEHPDHWRLPPDTEQIPYSF